MYKKIVLENGLRIILAPKEDSFSTTALILVGTGSEYETKEINGISHFLEHLCFKGTKKRPTVLDIVSGLDHLGAIHNAFTGNEYTGYFAKATPEHLKDVLDILSDIYQNPIFEPKEIEKEKQVIIEELNYLEDNPIYKAQSLFNNLLYKDQPAGWDIGGKKEIINKLEQTDVFKYRDGHYLAETTLIVLAGKFEEKEAIKLIENFFQGLKIGKAKEKTITKEFQKNPEVLLKTKDLEQTHFVLGNRAYNIFDKRRFALELLSDILGGGASSRLFQKIREQLGACYYIRSESDLSTDHGCLAISAGVDNNRVEEIISAILGELNQVKNKLISEKELQTTKNHLIGHLFLGLESSDELASFYGGQEILKEEIMTPEEISKKIQAVSKEEIQAVANDIFQNSKLNLALIGPQKDQGKIEKVLRF